MVSSITNVSGADLNDHIMSIWQASFTTYDDINVLTHLDCTVTNKSDYHLIVTNATLYCDNVLMNNTNYNESSGQWAIGNGFVFKTDIPVERESETIVKDTTYTVDGLMVISVRTIPGKAKKNNHHYLLALEYTSGNQSYIYRCEYPESTLSYALSIKAKGKGLVTYNGETIRDKTSTFVVNKGTNATISFMPDDGYLVKSLKVNGAAVTASASYTVTVNSNTSVEVEFEEIPPTTYSLLIKAIGNGDASYNGETIRGETKSFAVNEGTTVTVSFIPDTGYKIKSLKVNDVSVTIGTSYTFTINDNATVEVEFDEMIVISNFTVENLFYEVKSLEDHTIVMGAASNELTLIVPDKLEYLDMEWTVIGIAYDALDNCKNLAAIIWNPKVPFNAKVSNPNLLLYVRDEAYAQANNKNVVVNGYAQTITLTEAMSGNNFYCPVAFTAQSIEYTHNYLMKSGLNESRGWETIALPFDVQKISHSSKGEIVPFAKWTSGGSAKPFWLYELSGSGFVEAEAIKANTPYIISMPNNEAYPGEYQLTGRVTFSAENVEVKKSDEVLTTTYNNHTLMPSFINIGGEAGYYALNVNNDYEYYQGSENEGSKFILNLRKIHPFEAYMTSTSGTRSIDISEGMTTGIRGIEEIGSLDKVVKVYDLSGRLIKTNTTMEAIRQELPAGVYIVNNRKMIIK